MDNLTSQSEFMEMIVKSIVAKVAPDLTPEKRSEMEQQVLQLLIARLGTAIIAAMTPDDRKTYEREFIDTQKYNSPEAQAFVVEHVQNLEALMTQETKDLITEFVNHQ